MLLQIKFEVTYVTKYIYGEEKIHVKVYNIVHPSTQNLIFGKVANSKLTGA